jgi:pimeloyl-ACP methyl ester carboxylesterase
MEQGGPSSPQIPPRAHQTPKSSRQRLSSAAKSAIEPSPSSRPANSQPPPEVISSLISSLAAISTPAEHHFDQLSRIESKKSKSPSLALSYRTPSRSPVVDRFIDARDHSRSPPRLQGFGVDYGAYKQPEEVDQQSYLIANTAYAPIVRMSKPRAASSRSRSRTPTLKEPQQSLHPREETASVGRLSAEPGLQPSSASVASSKSGGISRMIGRKKSRETLSNGQNERSKSTRSNGDETLSPLSNGQFERSKPTGPNGEDSLSPSSSGVRHSNSRNNLIEDRIDEAVAGWQPSAPSPLTPSHHRPSGLTPVSPSNSRASDRPGGIGSGRIIPSRQSSLHYSTANSPGKKSSKSLRHSRGSKDLRIGQDVLEEEEDPTVRRIRELQKQKEKREKEKRRDERRAEKKKSRNSVPGAAPPQRTTSNPSSRHSMAEVMPRLSDQPAVMKNDGAPAPTLSKHNSRRLSTGQLPFSAGNNPRPRVSPVKHESRPSLGSRSVAPSIHQRTLSDPQFAAGRPSLGIDRPRSADSVDDAVEAYLASPRLTQRIRHPQTGRVIAFAEVGDPLGFPVICCVGMGMTRYVMAFYDELALTLRLRLITIDRPGVGESDPSTDSTGVPLSWPDDVSIVCNALSISRFSLLAHSAGAIYALATALRLPQQVRGRLHLMAPWIPPSQMSPIGSQSDAVPSNSVPYSQKLLRVLPASFLRAANSSLVSSTTSSVNLKSPRRSKRKSAILGNGAVDLPTSSSGPFDNRHSTQQSMLSANSSTVDLSNTSSHPFSTDGRDYEASRLSSGYLDDHFIRDRQVAYDAHLTQRIWDLAQRHANPAVDLLCCLERRQTIGFRYVDVTRACVFHHGTRDSRVPVENVKWLAKKMRRCEIRILEGEGHGLMASAKIMGEVLTEVAREWEDWLRVTREGRGRRFLADEPHD